MQTEINNLIGGAGTEFITGDARGKNYLYIVVNEDATFDNITGINNTNVMLSLGISDTNILRQGMVIRAKNDERIGRVNVTSGSVMGIL